MLCSRPRRQHKSELRFNPNSMLHVSPVCWYNYERKAGFCIRSDRIDKYINVKLVILMDFEIIFLGITI